jgi:hypothetical protein
MGCVQTLRLFEARHGTAYELATKSSVLRRPEIEMDFLIAETVCRIEILDSNYKIDTLQSRIGFPSGVFPHCIRPAATADLDYCHPFVQITRVDVKSGVSLASLGTKDQLFQASQS